jgi:hypothetical protein
VCSPTGPRRTLLFAAIFALIWLGVVTFNGPATHLTITNGDLRDRTDRHLEVEIRSNTKVELVAVERQLPR